MAKCGTNTRHPMHLDPQNVVFSLFTTKELKQLCVCRIKTPLMFDNLGYPLDGGLYDKRLGPLAENSDPCASCSKTYQYCPGHFGYIELPLVVVNPLFHKVVAVVLKLTCLSCHRMQLSESAKQLLKTQMKLLDKGLITDALQVEETLQHVPLDGAGHKDDDDSTDIDEQIINELKSIGACVDNTPDDPHNKTVSNKNIESLRLRFVYTALHQIKKITKCMNCKTHLAKMSTFKNRIMISSIKSNADDGIKVRELKNMAADEIQRCMRKLWENENELLIHIIPVLKGVDQEYPTDLFFMDAIVVPPCNVRPVAYSKGRITEHQQSVTYKAIINDAMLLRAIIRVVQNSDAELPDEVKSVYEVARGDSALEKLREAWQTLQLNVDALVDHSETMMTQGQGLKQLIEKKGGVIRMHMMGKRVNFAARSVITPDPNISIDEIGVPEDFAKCLTYPVPVTPWNVEELRKLIKNGPSVHPGAVLVEMENGMVTRINPGDKAQQEGILKRLLTPDDEKDTPYKGVKKVHRHLCNGDVMLLNRQPTLHKPSIMAHNARILKGEKTFRLHYANCKAYNADFDGDEMNAHLPQNELARSEAYALANVCNQYLVPKDGTPLSGLIQDHMVSGVKMSMRGRFFTKNDYQQLVYQALSHQQRDIRILPPAIIKPHRLWSGKQVLSTVIINTIPKGREAINLTATAKISANAFNTAPPRPWKGGGTPLKTENDMSEAEVVIRNGELLVGVLDKTHYGATPYGLVHCIYELYGAPYAIKFLSSLAKLFMHFLQTEGFTLGVHDILVLKAADEERSKIVAASRLIGNATAAAALHLETDAVVQDIVAKLEAMSTVDPKLRATMDREYKKNLDAFTNRINKTCLPAGLLCKFPHNNLQLMVQSGAKGSTVNTMQISCLLGQIELEGKRPPLMISGKSLPSFPVTEFAPRAGGFIDGRFMTGIKPQEFFFHCMAGREGLIDTAVKTSRSGYLQRCLIKHLEGLTVGYDLTVRDSDGSVIQFYYGEDGMDVSKVQFLNDRQIKFLAENTNAIVDVDLIANLKDVHDYTQMSKHGKKLNKWKQTHGDPLAKQRISPFTLFSDVIKEKIERFNNDDVDKATGRDQMSKTICDLWSSADADLKTSFKKNCDRCPMPMNSVYQPDYYFGSLNERLMDIVRKNKAERNDNFTNMVKLKAMQGLCVPGEPVGLLAAQSIGEPSTQMTLNTFHFAGRGEMNVTLGIPRLREILMLATTSIKTPSMEVPFLPISRLETKAAHLRKVMNRVVVSDVLEKVDVTVRLDLVPNRQQRYTLRFHFLPEELYNQDYKVTPKFVLKHMTKTFFGQMFMVIKKRTKINSGLLVVDDKKKPVAKKTNNDDDDAEEDGEANDKTIGAPIDKEFDSSDEEPEDLEDAKQTKKFETQRDDMEAESDDDVASSGDEKDKKEEEDESPDVLDNDETKVVNSYQFAQDYAYDKEHSLWCELTFAIPMMYKQLDLTAILTDVASKSVLWETPQIRRAITYTKDGKLTLRTDGINTGELFKYYKILDLNKLYCNDIHKVAETYGIEAAAKVIVKEVQDVFNVYGIKVDPRHLSLIADYMTFDGTFKPLSRKGMESSASPLQQMSFESALTFLRAATIQGKSDSLRSPSSCLMVGKPCQTGTGSFKLLHKMQRVATT